MITSPRIGVSPNRFFQQVVTRQGRALALTLAFIALAAQASLSFAQFSPSGGQTVEGSEIQFSWPAVTDAVRYNVFAAFDAGDLDPTSNADFALSIEAPNLSLTITGMPNDGSTIYWIVKTLGDGLQTIDTSPVQNFINGQTFTPDPPTPVHPRNNAIIKVNRREYYSWTSSSGANSYILQVDDNAGFSSPQETQVPGIFGDIKPPTDVTNQGKTFFWRVKACYTVPGPAPVQLCSAFSETFQYTIAEPGGPDIKVVPDELRFTLSPDGPTSDQAGSWIINVGESPLTVSSISDIGTPPTWMTFDLKELDRSTPASLPKTLNQYERFYVNVEVDRTGVGDEESSHSLEIRSDDPDEDPYPPNLQVFLTVPGASIPPPCHPADGTPYGNNDGIITTAEADAYMNAWFAGDHEDLAGVLSAVNIAQNGGLCSGEAQAACSEALPDSQEIYTCVCSTRDGCSGTTVTIAKMSGSAPAGTVKLRKLAGDGKVEIQKASDGTVILGENEIVSMDLRSELNSSSLPIVIHGKEYGVVPIQVEYIFESGGENVECPPRDENTITVNVIGVDLDVDSDNTNFASDFAPDRDEAEETIEDDPAETGLLILSNNGDDDGDGIDDWGDGYNLDTITDACELAGGTTYTVTNVFYGDVTKIDLSGRGFTNFSFWRIGQGGFQTQEPGWDTTFANTGVFHFVPAPNSSDLATIKAGGAYMAKMFARAECSGETVDIDVNIEVKYGHTLAEFSASFDTRSGIGPTIDMYRLQQRLKYLEYTTLSNDYTLPPSSCPPIIVDGRGDTPFAQAFQMFSRNCRHVTGPASGMSTFFSNNPNNTFTMWLNVENPPFSFRDLPTAAKHPGLYIPASFTNGWVGAVVDDALSSRPELIRNSPTANGGIQAIGPRAAYNFHSSVFNGTNDEHRSGFTLDWGTERSGIIAGVGALDPGQPLLPQLTASEARLIEDIMAVKAAADAHGMTLQKISTQFDDYPRIQQAITILGIPTFNFGGGVIAHIHYYFSRPTMGPLVGAQNPIIE